MEAVIIIWGVLITITIIVGVIYKAVSDNKNKSNQSTTRAPQQNLSEPKKDTFLSSAKKERINELAEKYYLPISNYAKRRHSCNKYGFAYILWRNTGWSFAGNDFYVMEETNPTLRKIITDDWGKRRMEYNRYRGYFHPDTIESSGEELKFLIKSLKEKILSANEWSDFETLDIAIYFIIRNGLLKYFNNTYE